MSNMTAVRSIAVRPSIFSRVACWAGLSSSSNTTVSASCSSAISRISATLPLPTKVLGSGAGRRWVTRATSSAPAVCTSRWSSSNEASVSSVVADGKVTPTSTIFSRKVRSMKPCDSPPNSPNAPRWSEAASSSPESPPSSAQNSPSSPSAQLS